MTIHDPGMVNAAPRRDRAAAAVVAGLATMLLGCSDDEPEAQGPPSTERTDTTFTTDIFEVPFTIDVPDGWTVLERRTTIAQLWEGDDEELSAAELTISTDVKGSVAQLDEAFRNNRNISVSELDDAEYGPYEVQQIDVETDAVVAIPGGYQLEPGGEVRVAFFTIGDVTVLAYLDGFADVEPPDGVRRKMAELAGILATIRFDAAPSG